MTFLGRTIAPGHSAPCLGSSTGVRCWLSVHPAASAGQVATAVLRACGRGEPQTQAVGAIAQARRRGTIVKDVADMAAATGADHLRANGAITCVMTAGISVVGQGVDGTGDRFGKAGPAGPAFELAAAFEERCIAADARENARAIFV